MAMRLRCGGDAAAMRRRGGDAARCLESESEPESELESESESEPKPEPESDPEPESEPETESESESEFEPKPESEPEPEPERERKRERVLSHPPIADMPRTPTRTPGEPEAAGGGFFDASPSTRLDCIRKVGCLGCPGTRRSDVQPVTSQ